MRAVFLLLLLASSLTLAAQSGPQLDVTEKSIAQLQSAMQSGQVTSRQLVDAYLARIAAYDRQGPRLNAVIALNSSAAADADALDKERSSKGPRGPLHGIPILVKDNYETVGMPTTAGSLALAGYQSRSDAFQVRKLREAGAVIIGKTNMHELASGITNVSSTAGQTRNPYDLGRYPGGSSGGTGAALAANFATAGMGSDTCGSIRIPAASNNLVGLRGTRGLASGTGIIPLSHTQDIGGPLARTLADLVVMLDATVGVDAADAATAAAAGHIPKSYADALQPGGLKGARLGVLKIYVTPDEDGSAVVLKAIEQMKAAGAEIVDLEVPGLADLLRDSSVINMEFTPNLAEFLAARDNAPIHSLDEIVKLGLYDASMEERLAAHLKAPRPGSDEYRRALVKRDAIRNAVVAAMDEHRLTAIVYPTMRRKPARIGEPQPGTNCQLSASSGLPALSVPAGFTDDGLPIGVEFLGRAWSEGDLLKVAFGWEQTAKLRRAPFSTPPLVNGKGPLPVAFGVSAANVRARFSYEPTTAELKFTVTSVPRTGLRLVALHRAIANGAGPIVARLVEAGTSGGSGVVTLGHLDREALAAGRLYLQVHMAGAPDDRQRLALTLPSN
jgi:Asp-tRNA(Asn)/Glu-tRNA(Gln) amidotransferase A subunit family amidase